MKRLVTGVVVAGALTLASTLPASLSFASTHSSDYSAARQALHAQAPSPDAIVATAKQHLGDPYATIGNTPAGFSCIGFVNYIFNQNGVYVPFDIPMAWSSEPHVAQSDLMPGDVLFFSNTVFAGLSHVAIYIGNDQMIGADSFTVGVTTDTLSDSYWQEHYTGATRPLAMVGAAPQPNTTTPSSQTQDTATPVPTPPPAAATAPVGALLRPLSATVGLYSGPGYEYTAITTLAPNTVLTVVQTQGGWYDAQFGGTYGWVNAGDVELAPADQSQPAATATPQPGPDTESDPSHAHASAVSNMAPGSTLVVAQGPLWVRSGPGKSFSPVGFLKTGAHITVLDMHPHWAHISAPSGITGWVALAYVRPAPMANFSQASTAPGNVGTQVNGALARVKATVLNVRTLPDTHARVITVLFLGETVHIIGTSGRWDHVQLKTGATGWVDSAWVVTT